MMQRGLCCYHSWPRHNDGRLLHNNRRWGMMTMMWMMRMHGMIYICTLCILNCVGTLFVADSTHNIPVGKITHCSPFLMALGLVQSMLTSLGIVNLMCMLFVSDSSRNVPMGQIVHCFPFLTALCMVHSLLSAVVAMRRHF